MEVSSASADDDSVSNIVPKNVKAGVPKNVKAGERVSTPSGSSISSSVQSILTITANENHLGKILERADFLQDPAKIFLRHIGREK